MFSNNIGLVRIYCPCRSCTFVIHVSSFFAQRPKARKPSATLADLKTHGARRVDRRGFHLLGRDGRKQISTSYDTYIYIYIHTYIYIYLVYTSYIVGMHTANGVSIMLPIAAYEHLSKNWEWECDPEFLQLEKNETLQQGCRFVPSTFSETIRHRWYLWIYCKYW